MSTLSPSLPLALTPAPSETVSTATPNRRSIGPALSRVVAAIIAHRQARADAEIARRMAWRQ